jgi:hypothetical protein
MTNGAGIAAIAAAASATFPREVTGADPRHVMISRILFFRSEPLIPDAHVSGSSMYVSQTWTMLRA